MKVSATDLVLQDIASSLRDIGTILFEMLDEVQKENVTFTPFNLKKAIEANKDINIVEVQQNKEE